MGETFTNGASTTLNGAIDGDDTTIVVTSATGFPTTAPFRIRIKAEGANTNEICTVTAGAGTTSWTVTRASEAYAGSSSSSSHASGATVQHVLTAGGLVAYVSPDTYKYINAQLEPLAIEALQIGTFSYAINSSTTKMVLNAYATRLGSAGRWEVRDPRYIVPLRNVTVTGLISTSTGVFINPALATYTNGYQTYLERLTTIAETSTKYWQESADSTYQVFLPGPYGSIITSVNVFDSTWLVATQKIGATIYGWNLSNEIADAAGDYQRIAHGGYIPVHINVVSRLQTGVGATFGGAASDTSITYIICPSTFGKVTDSNTYIFRDDFMESTINTASKWNLTESTADNIEIDTNFAWLKIQGNGTWGANALVSQSSTSRAAGKKVEYYVYTGDLQSNLEPGMVGWHDGAGTSYTDLLHAINFQGDGTLDIYEKGVLIGNNLGTVRSFTVYRCRITLASTGATYEIQGGDFAALGGASWTTLTPGTASSGTDTPCYWAIVPFSTTASAQKPYIGDFRVYS